MDNFFIFYEKYILTIYVIHIILSIILSYGVSIYLKGRYATTGKEIKKDKVRIEAIALEGSLFKLLFKVSLRKNNRITNFLFIFFFNLPIPIIGYIATLWISWYLKHITYEKKVILTNTLNLDEFATSFLKVERIFGEGSLGDLMTSPYAPKAKKLKALSSLAAHISPTNLKIVKQTLMSTDDEIRMFGYAIINKAEKSLNQKMNVHLEILEEHKKGIKVHSESVVAHASKELAYLYWEMVYTELAHDSLKNNFLNQSIHYLEFSKEYYNGKIEKLCVDKSLANQPDIDNDIELQDAYKTCSSLYLLMGRIRMFKKEYEQAKTEFTIAQELTPNNDTFVLPYLAEVYFLTGKYSIVKTLLGRAKTLEMNATLYPIIQQWKVA